MANNKGHGGMSWDMVLKVAAVIFALGGAYAILRAETETNRCQDVKLEQNTAEHRQMEQMLVRMDERGKRIEEKIGDIHGRLEILHAPE